MSSESNQGGAIVVVAAVVLVLFLGVVVLGVGGLFLFRSASLESNQVMEQALVAERDARRQIEVVEQQRLLQEAQAASADMADSSSAESIVIVLDDAGNMTVDGEPVVADDLPQLLQQRSSSAEGARASVSIQAAMACEFRHVAKVLNDCREIGLETVISSNSNPP